MNKPKKSGLLGTSPTRLLSKLFRPKADRSANVKTGSVRLNRSLREQSKAKKDARARKKAEYLASLPKSRIKRFFYRLNPKRVAKYWFSRDGLIMALKISGVGLAVGIIAILSIFSYFRKDLPNLKDVSGNDRGGSVRYYDKTGQTLLWEDFDSFKRIPVTEDQISQSMKDATVAIEDKDFYNHNGFNLRGITRAAINNITNKTGGTQGGSTITQQLVKITQNWDGDKTYTRKIKELILAIELERSFSKKEILAGYLNNAPYGSFETGVESAAQTYFNKSAKDLTLDESAMLAAIPKTPTYLSVYNTETFDKDFFLDRQKYVLTLMHEQGYITAEQRDEAIKIDTLAKVKDRKPKYEGIKAPYFVLAARQQLVEKFDQRIVQRGGWKVTTTLDLNIQSIAEDEYQKGLPQVRRQGGNTAAFVAEDVKTGQVIAMVGGPDFFDKNSEDSEYNYATAELPPGSSFKPYDYLSLIEHSEKFGAGSVLYDTQGALEGYPCTNKSRPKQGGNCLWDYDFRYPGPLTLRYALGGSRNVPAVKAMLLAGIDKTIETAKKLGLSSGYKCYDPVEYDKGNKVEMPCYSSSAIGDGAFLRLDEHVHAYASISRNGRNIPQTYILKIEDNRNKIVDEWKPSEGEQAVRDEAAYIVADMMSDPKASYLGKKTHNYKNHKLSIKTGTTNDSKDGWMMGFSTQIAAGVWVGHTDRKEMSGFMENMTQPIWDGFMKRVHDNLTPEERPKPAGLQTLDAYIVRSHVGVSSVEPSPEKDLFPSWYKQAKKDDKSKKVIDTVSNKLATDCTPARAKKEIYQTDANSFAAGDTYATGNANTQETDDVHKCDDIKPGINLTVVKNGATYSLTATATQGTHPLKTINFKIGDQILPGGSFEVSGTTTVSLTYKPDSDGQQTVIAEVIDEVLYDASDQKTVSFEAGGGTINLTYTKLVGGSVAFSWSSLPSADSYELCYSKNNGNNTCNSTNSTSKTVSLSAGNYTATVKAKKDSNTLSTSEAVSFTIP